MDILFLTLGGCALVVYWIFSFIAGTDTPADWNIWIRAISVISWLGACWVVIYILGHKDNE